MDFLSEFERDLIASDLSDIVTDPSISGTVLYQRNTGKADFDPSTGRQEVQFAKQWIRAIRAPISEKQIQLSDGKYQSGDIRYMIRYTDVTNPSKDDRIVDESKTMYAIDILTDPLRIFHSLITRNLRGK